MSKVSQLNKKCQWSDEVDFPLGYRENEGGFSEVAICNLIDEKVK